MFVYDVREMKEEEKRAERKQTTNKRGRDGTCIQVRFDSVVNQGVNRDEPGSHVKCTQDCFRVSVAKPETPVDATRECLRVQICYLCPDSFVIPFNVIVVLSLPCSHSPGKHID